MRRTIRADRLALLIAARRRVDALRTAIRQQDYNHYSLDRPTISDAEYDALFTELVRLETAHPELVTPDSPTELVGGPTQERFPPVKHLAPMLSLEAGADQEAIRRFDERMRDGRRGQGADGRVSYLLEPKFDGLSLEVVYRDGVFWRASTRGDGERGERVTGSVRAIRSVPLVLQGSQVPRLLAVRGEAVIRLDDFRALNARLEQEGQVPISSPRNAAAGTIRQLDPRLGSSGRLDVFFYDILRIEGGPSVVDGSSLLERLAEWGFRASPYARVVTTVDEILQYREEMAARRDSLPFEIDGIVVKLDDLSMRERLAAAGRHPLWALAYKFTVREEETILDDIVVQVGPTGVLTAVAVVRPVKVDGVLVSRIPFRDREEIARRDLRVGDRVRVTRAGEAVPPLLERAPGDGVRRRAPFVMPSRCPACQANVMQEGPLDRCPNALACRAQLEHTLEHFASREAMDIPGLSREAANTLVSADLVHSVADLFALTPRDLAKLDGFDEASAARLVDAVEHAKRPVLCRFLHALGIPGLTVQAARVLAAHVGSLDQLQAASEAALMKAPGIDPAVAHNVVSFFARAGNQRVVELCRRRGVDVVDELPSPGGPLAGKTVVAGIEPGAKGAKARALGVPVIDERRFQKLARRVSMK